jgi:HD-like signal output (HDOD) protein
MPLVEAERLTLEFIHTDISAYLLKEWNFPVQFRDLINRHHAPMEAPEPLEAAVVHLADVMANALGVAEGGMYAVPSLDEEAWRILGLKPTDLHAVADEFDAQYEKTVAAFF